MAKSYINAPFGPVTFLQQCFHGFHGSTDVAGLVLRQSAGPVLAGLAIGLGAALGMSRLIRSMLYQVTPSDPVVFASVALGVAAAAAFACLLPLRRALGVDPLSALRCE